MIPEELKNRSMKGLVWAAGESAGVALISFGSFIVLARLLAPEDFGVVALATVFVYFCNLLTGHSFADALVQRPALDRDHVDTAFWSTLAIALLLMAACMAGADAIAAGFEEPALAGALRWLSLLLPLAALSSTHTALMRREMRFDAVARRMLLGRCIGAAAGIAAAVAGHGFWSLVVQQLVGQLVTTIAFLIASWRPRLNFSPARFREMWAFGVHVSANQVVTGASEQMLNLLVGSIFGTVALGYFTIAWRAVNLVRSLVSSAVYHVGLSAFSKLQQDRRAVSDAFLTATRISCLVGFPVAIGIVMVDEPLVLAAFDEPWRNSIPLLALLALELVPAFYGMFLSVLYRAMDRAAWGLAMALLYGALGLGGALAVAPLGIEAVAAIWVVRAFLLMPLHVALVHRLLDLPLQRLAAPVLPPLVAATLMAAVLGALRLMLPGGMLPLAELALLVSVGVAVYTGAIRVLSPQLVGLALRAAGRISAPSGKSP